MVGLESSLLFIVLLGIADVVISVVVAGREFGEGERNVPQIGQKHMIARPIMAAAVKCGISTARVSGAYKSSKRSY